VLYAEVEGRGPRLVLVHGFTQTGRSWGPVATDLARHHEVVRVDAPGHGRSAALALDMVEGARLLGETGGAATYIGYSMGARLCLQLALDHPQLVDALVLLGGTAGIENPAERRARRRDDEALARELEQVGWPNSSVRWLARPLFAGLDEAAAGMDARLANTVAGLATSSGWRGREPRNRCGRACANWPCRCWPWRGRTTVASRSRAQAMVAAIGPNAELAVVPGAGHAAQSEAPEAFLAIVHRFLARTGTTPAGS